MNSEQNQTALSNEKSSKRAKHGWVMYDWANSVYSLAITTAIFPAYFMSVLKSREPAGFYHLAGIEIDNGSVYPYLVSFSFLLVSILNPILAGIADRAGNKKQFLRFFAWLGAFCCAALFFFTDANLTLGIAMAIGASVGFAGSLVFYNAYLPEIAMPSEYDRLSARGFSMGYIGSVIHLLLALMLITFHEEFHISEGMAARISFLTTGVWWFLFAEYSFARLPRTRNASRISGDMLLAGFTELRSKWHLLKNDKSGVAFLSAYFFYNLGVQTVMYMATLFASEKLKIPIDKMIPAVLIIQLVAIGGAILFGRLSESKGNKFSLMAMIGIWILICLSVFLVKPASKSVVLEFYALAAAVGLVMGGIQSLSRASFSKLLPSTGEDHASYFGIYDFVEKISIVAGTALFGLFNAIFADMVFSILPLLVSFVIGMLILAGIKDTRWQPARTSGV